MRQKLLLVTGTGTGTASTVPTVPTVPTVGIIKRTIIQQLCYDPIVTYTESSPPGSSSTPGGREHTCSIIRAFPGENPPDDCRRERTSSAVSEESDGAVSVITYRFAAALAPLAAILLL